MIKEKTDSLCSQCGQNWKKKN